MGFLRLPGKQKISLAFLGGWLLAWLGDPLITILRLNVETWATERGLHKLYDHPSWSLVAGWLVMLVSWLDSIYVALTGPLGLGFALGAVIFAFWDPVARRVSSNLRGKLRIGRFEVADILMERIDSPVIGLRLRFYLHNHSHDQEIHFLLIRSSLSIDGRINPEARIEMPIATVHPNSSQAVTLAVVPRLERKALYRGKDDLVLHYGARKSRLQYSLEHEGTLDIQIIYHENGQFTYNVDCSHQKIDHRKIRVERPDRLSNE